MGLHGTFCILLLNQINKKKVKNHKLCLFDIVVLVVVVAVVGCSIAQMLVTLNRSTNKYEVLSLMRYKVYWHIMTLPAALGRSSRVYSMGKHGSLSLI